MSEGKHTPGPWRVSGKKSVRGQNGEYIASANWSNGENNARLIAAAPELLDALEAITGLYDTDEGCRSLPEYKAARAAIAKAKG